MEQTYLGDYGPKVSPAIYGFYRWEGEATSDKMETIVNLCLELGINSFDHADVYGNYRCEELFGEIIKWSSIKREDIVLFSKCGLRIPHNSQPDVRIRYYDTSSRHIQESIEASLRKLRTDYIDIFLLDHLDPISDLEATAHTLEALRDAGKIKNIGISAFTVFQHQLLASYLKAPIVTNHIELSLLNTAALQNGQLDYCKQRYMKPLATAPLAAGRIATGIDRQAINVRGKLKEIAPKYDADIESIAIAWLTKLDVLPLIGTTDEQRIRNIAASFSIDMDRQDWYELYEAAKI